MIAQTLAHNKPIGISLLGLRIPSEPTHWKISSSPSPASSKMKCGGEPAMAASFRAPSLFRSELFLSSCSPALGASVAGGVKRSSFSVKSRRKMVMEGSEAAGKFLFYHVLHCFQSKKFVIFLWYDVRRFILFLRGRNCEI